MKDIIDGLDKETVEEIARHYRAILSLIGEDPDRDGLIKTPMRAAKAMAYLTSGYRKSAEDTVNAAIFDYAGSQMVTVRNIEFYSLCEHHILPFFGTVSIGYVPGGKMIGLSKLARTVEVFARRLQVQERLTRQICDVLSAELSAKGVIVCCEASHLCMRMRGVEKECADTRTIEYSGLFCEQAYRQEFFNLISKR